MEKIKKTFELIVLAICMMVPLFVIIGLPIFALYKFIAPLFGTDPEGHLRSVLTNTLYLGGIVGGIIAAFMLGVWLYQKSNIARKIIGGLAVIFVALIVVSSLSQCMSGSFRCTSSRYIDC